MTPKGMGGTRAQIAPKDMDWTRAQTAVEHR